MEIINTKVALVTNIPSPYRIPIYRGVNKKFPNFKVFFCAEKEPNRKWSLTLDGFNFKILRRGLIFSKKDGFNYVHLNFDILKQLFVFKPEIIITTGYNPTHLLAMFYAFFFNKQHIVMSDGWVNSEMHLSWIHRIIRKIAFKMSTAFIGAGSGTFKLFQSYGIKSEECFQSHLCIDNKRFENELSFDERPYDLMFAGNIQEVKMPLLFADIVIRLSKSIPNLKVIIIGDGPLREKLLSKLKENCIDFEYCGFISQALLPSYYSKAKLLLFTTRNDVWGVVCNEALASGTPVVSTIYTAIVDDLLIDKHNGAIVRDYNDLEQWDSSIQSILLSKQKWAMLSVNAKQSVMRFNYENASKGICDAVTFCNIKRLKK